MNESEKSGLRAKLRSGKILEILVVIVLVVIVLVIVLSTFGEKDTQEKTAEETYALQLSAQLEEVLSQIEGAGNVKVMITVASEGETVLATETIENADGSVTTQPILVGGAVGVLEEKNPEISGVLIVADGANDLNVRFNLLEAAASVLNINQSIIKVYAGSEK